MYKNAQFAFAKYRKEVQYTTYNADISSTRNVYKTGWIQTRIAQPVATISNTTTIDRLINTILSSILIQSEVPSYGCSFSNMESSLL